ncbi:uncharacterized protein C19orf47 [Trichonephila clavipes]|nr:uncharacterized protein C19orf47 [Trichonephila clavipes]
MKTRYDTKATGHQFKEGDRVWFYNPTRRKGLSPKLQSHWDGPYTILKIINDVVIRIRLKKKSTIISLKRKASEESPVKRIRQVPPGEEGAYKIKMPSGTTERTRKILQQQGTKRSVFARLGDSAVSSSTDSKVSSSVFERLGPSSKNICDDTPSSTVLSDFERPKREQPLQYRGVLKMTVGKNRTVTTTASRRANAAPRTVIKPSGFQRPNITKTVKLNQINSILQASKYPGSRVKTTSQGIFGNRIEKTSVKSRLGDKIDARNLTRTTMQLKNRVPTKSQSNVFARLGR